jgi:hypothetical protein
VPRESPSFVELSIASQTQRSESIVMLSQQKEVSKSCPLPTQTTEAGCTHMDLVLGCLGLSLGRGSFVLRVRERIYTSSVTRPQRLSMSVLCYASALAGAPSSSGSNKAQPPLQGALSQPNSERQAVGDSLMTTNDGEDTRSRVHLACLHDVVGYPGPKGTLTKSVQQTSVSPRQSQAFAFRGAGQTYLQVLDTGHTSFSNGALSVFFVVVSRGRDLVVCGVSRGRNFGLLSGEICGC